MRVDIHTHVFNLRSLPVPGILRRWGLPTLLARAVAKFFLSMVEDDIEELAAIRAAVAAERRQGGLARDVVPLLAAEAPPELFHDEEFLTGLLYVEPDALAARLAPSLAAKGMQPSELGLPTGASVQTLAALNLAALDSSTRSAIVEAMLRKVESLIEGGAGAMRFLALLTRSERHILETYRAEYPEIALNIHHMMDLECHYPPDPPVYSYPADQVSRMRKLAAASDGRLVIFVAFDPYRPNCQEIIESAVSAGCAGVKFYPPSGYKPAGNKDGEYDGPPAWQLNERNDRLFAYCARTGIPVFVHCTPSGFLARDDYWEFSKPEHWAPVLKRYPSLLLCFGHAGGAQGWFAAMDAAGEQAFERSFAGGVFALMQAHEGVYLDFGYLDEVLDPVQLASLRTRLEAMVGRVPTLAQRFMYGSDWHMIYKEAESERYLHAFESVFAGALAPHRDAFFGGNAVKYLNLRAYVDRNRGVLTAAARSHLEALAK